MKTFITIGLLWLLVIVGLLKLFNKAKHKNTEANELDDTENFY